MGDTGFALLRLDQTILLVPRNDIRVLELTIDVVHDEPPPDGVGWIEYQRQAYPVYCLDDELRCSTDIITGRSACVILAADRHIYGLLCSEIVMSPPPGTVIHDMPIVMRSANSPIRGLATYAGHLACVTSARQLWAQRLSELETAGEEQ